MIEYTDNIDVSVDKILSGTNLTLFLEQNLCFHQHIHFHIHKSLKTSEKALPYLQ